MIESEPEMGRMAIADGEGFAGVVRTSEEQDEFEAYMAMLNDYNQDDQVGIRASWPLAPYRQGRVR